MVSAVAPPMWGVRIMLWSLSRGLSGAVGWVSNTSKAAPAIRPGVEGVYQRGLVYHGWVGTVYQIGGGFHPGDCVRVNHAGGGGRGGEVEAYEVGVGGEGLQGGHADIWGRVGYIGVVGYEVHAEGGAHRGELEADSAESDDAEGSALYFYAAHGGIRLDGVLPLGGGDVGVGAGDLAGEGEHEGQGVFGDGAGVPGGGVDDGDSALGGGLDVYVVSGGAAYSDESKSGRVGHGFLENEVGFHDEDGDAGRSDSGGEFFWVGKASGVQPAFVFDGHGGREGGGVVGGRRGRG